MQAKADEIFVVDGEKLTPIPARSMREGFFGKTMEDALQTLLERYPDIIPGRQIEPGSEDPPCFALLRREMPVVGSLDHLYVDQRAVLTLVEAKLVQNPQARREVIGQIIEYAANAAESWGQGRIKAAAADYHKQHGRELDEVLQAAFGEELDVKAFWPKVEENLERGRFRLIIAGDELRPEVRRMIEYLNQEMQNAEVLGLELKCYGKSGSELVMVPHIVGQTQATADRRSTSQTTRWTPERIKAELDKCGDPVRGKRLRDLLAFALESHAFKLSSGKMMTFGITGKTNERIVSFWGDGTGYLRMKPEVFLDSEGDRKEFIQTMKDIGLIKAGVNPDDVTDGKNFAQPIENLSDDEFATMMDMFRSMCAS